MTLSNKAPSASEYAAMKRNAANPMWLINKTTGLIYIPTGKAKQVKKETPLFFATVTDQFVSKPEPIQPLAVGDRVKVLETALSIADFHNTNGIIVQELETDLLYDFNVKLEYKCDAKCTGHVVAFNESELEKL